jgi:hypothetical protein
MLSIARNLPASRLLCGSAIIAAGLLPSAAVADNTRAPLQFFNGKTEMNSTVKVVMKKPYKSRTLGSGRLNGDGVLALSQMVYDEGRFSVQRNWKIRQVTPGHYAGSMSEAVGPVTVDEVDGRYRFKFKMKGGLAVEQWMTPMPGGNAAKSNVTVRKLGMKVASSTGVIRKLS